MLHKGTTTLKNNILDHQYAKQKGGAIYVNEATLMVETSSMNFNETDVNGGAIKGMDAKLAINRSNFTLMLPFTMGQYYIGVEATLVAHHVPE